MIRLIVCTIVAGVVGGLTSVVTENQIVAGIVTGFTVVIALSVWKKKQY